MGQNRSGSVKVWLWYKKALKNISRSGDSSTPPPTVPKAFITGKITVGDVGRDDRVIMDISGGQCIDFKGQPLMPDFLTNKMWDDEYGGFYQMVSREGDPVNNSGDRITKTRNRGVMGKLMKKAASEIIESFRWYEGEYVFSAKK